MGDYKGRLDYLILIMQLVEENENFEFRPA